MQPAIAAFVSRQSATWRAFQVPSDCLQNQPDHASVALPRSRFEHAFDIVTVVLLPGPSFAPAIS